MFIVTEYAALNGFPSVNKSIIQGYFYYLENYEKVSKANYFILNMFGKYTSTNKDETNDYRLMTKNQTHCV